MRFYIKPAMRPDTEDIDYKWEKLFPDAWKTFKSVIKSSFRPTNGSASNNHFPINRYSLPRYFNSIHIGFVKCDGVKYDLYIEKTPGASMIVFNHTEFCLRIVQDGYRMNGTEINN